MRIFSHSTCPSPLRPFRPFILGTFPPVIYLPYVSLSPPSYIYMHVVSLPLLIVPKLHKHQQLQATRKKSYKREMAGASSRLLGATTKAFHADNHLPSSSSSCNNNPCHLPSLKFPFLREKKHKLSHHAEQKVAFVSSEVDVIVAPEKRRRLLLEEERRNVDLLSPLVNELARRLLLRLFGVTRILALTQKCRPAIFEALIEKGVIGCQSFTLIGVVGSLVGSVLCFVEGCAVVLKSFFTQFRAMSQQMVDQAEIIKLLIEAIDMFLVGTALLTFGMGLYIMFAGSKNRKETELQIDQSNLGLFNLKKLKGAKTQSITQAKTRIGHAVVLLLQAGVLEKFKNVPLVTGLDMACFAGAVFASSASVFLLSKLTVQQQRCRQTCI